MDWRLRASSNDVSGEASVVLGDPGIKGARDAEAAVAAVAAGGVAAAGPAVLCGRA